jgi:hypothetical protein
MGGGGRCSDTGGDVGVASSKRIVFGGPPNQKKIKSTFPRRLAWGK